MSRSVLFDTETTGLDPQAGDRIIEIAALELLRDLPTGRHFHALVHPERDIPAEATRIHGISLLDLRDKPAFHAIAHDLAEFLADDPLVAHNAAFDFGFLDAEFDRIGRPKLGRHRMICTLELAKKRYPGLPNSLDALCRRFAVDLTARVTHNALLDCRLLAEVYIELTGGRQRGLLLADDARDAGGLVAVAYAAVQRRAVVMVEPTDEELASHAAFIARMPDAVWAAER